MQVAIISDVHANMQAWNSVLLDIRSLDLDSIFCLGDTVGYGPNPAEVLSSIHTNVEHLVLGNHDAVVCGKLKPDLFNDSAAELIRWTSKQLNNQAVDFLASLPLSIDCGDFRCSHGDLADPAAFNYICDPDDAALSWRAMPGNLFFVGHTHEPAIFVLGTSGVPRSVTPQDFMVEDDRRYIVNCGSVGQPRDGMALASYCIYDTDTRAVFWRRVPFDLDEYRRSAASAGIDESVSWFLNFDPRNRATAARNHTDFSPAKVAEDRATHVVEVKELNLLALKARRWKTSFTALLTASLLLLGAFSTAGLLHATKGATIPAIQPASSTPPCLASLNLDRNPALPLSDFNISIGNKRRQTVSIEYNYGSNLLHVASSSIAPIIFETPSIPASAKQKMTLEALMRRSSDFTGSTTVYVAITRESEGKIEHVPQFLVKDPNMERKNGFILARQTFDLPAGTTHVALGLAASFTGELDISGLNLTLKE